MKKILNNKWFYFTIIFIFILVFNFLTPYILDDYQLMYDYTMTKRIDSIIRVFKELYHMYFNWGGRMVAHFFAYTFLALPKWIFNIVNSIVYVLDVYLVYLIARGNKKDNYKYLLLIHMIIFIFIPTFAQTFLWLDGSCNYSFTLLMELFFIYKILNIKDNKYNYIKYIIISLLAGMCNENASLSLIVFLVLYTIYDKSNLKLKVTSFISIIVGYLFMFLAPGNYIRMETVSENTSFFHNFFEKLAYLTSNFWPIIIGILLIVIVFLIKNKEKGKICLIMYICSLISFYSMMASPQLSLRSFTITTIYIFIIVMTILFNINKEIIKKITYISISIIFIFTFIPTSIEYYDYYIFMNNRHNKIIQSKKENIKSVGIKVRKNTNNCRIPTSCELEDIQLDKTGFPNCAMSKYYGIDIYGYK